MWGHSHAGRVGGRGSNRECIALFITSHAASVQESYCQYWLDDEAQEFGEYVVTVTEETQHDGFTERSFSISDPNVRTVRNL